MFSSIKQVWLDTATNTANGQFSQKRIMKWLAFGIAAFLCIADVVELHFSHGFDIQIRRPEPEIVLMLLAYSLGESVATIAGKYLNRKTTDDNGNPLEPATPTPTEPLNENQNGITQ